MMRRLINRPLLVPMLMTRSLKHRGLRSILVGLLCLCLPAISVGQFYNYPGGIIDLSIEKQSAELPDVKYGISDVTIFDLGNQWRVLVGISLATLPGDYLLYIKQPNDDTPAFDRKFTVSQKKPMFLNTERATAPKVFEHDVFSDISFSNTVEPELPLNYPADGQWADQFGAIEILGNDGDTHNRNYISLTTTKLLTVTAPHNGIVSRVIKTQATRSNSRVLKNNYTLFLDHGRGLYSILSGVMDITVEPGNGVLAGAVLGKVYTENSSSNQPNTLIWQTVLNNTYVNPVILTEIR